MKKLIFSLLLLPLGLWAQPFNIISPIRFLALGDSYTIGESVPSAQNWPHQLRDSLATRGVVTDSLLIIATTGWRTDNLLSAIQNQNLDAGHFNLVSLLIGVNNQYQGRNISQYITELPILIDSAIRYAGGDTSHVFIVSIPDYAYTPFGQQGGNAATISSQLDNYNRLGKLFADSFHIRFFDITPISRQGLNDPSLVASDGLHPSAVQYAKWVHLIMQTVDSAAITSGIQNMESDFATVFPNPVCDEIHIRLAQKSIGEMRLYDATGRLLLSQKIEGTDNILSTAGMVDGIYMVEVQTGVSTAIKKIVIDGK